MRIKELNIILFNKIVVLYFITMFSLVNISIAATGGKIRGLITDVNSGKPLAGANIIIENQMTGAATDLEGEYYILNIPSGTYSVTASMIGFKSVTKTNVRVYSDRTIIINFQLEEQLMELDETITVVAERPLIEQDETSTRHYVESAEIVNRPTAELTQILTTLPSIDIDAGGELVVRRGSLDQVAFLIDGMRARNPLDFQPYTNINLTAIQELEIITGGFNAEYGEAQSGVFNILTKDGSENLEAYAEIRWTPPGKRHWGTAFYDYSTDKYWENTHARHLQWWIDHPDQWVDPNGLQGNDPNSSWTPEQAYEDYMNTHQPLNDYTEKSSFQTEISVGGPTPIEDLFFFVSGKYRTAPPITGNSYRSMGKWYDATAKFSYNLSTNMKFMFSAIYNKENSSFGMQNMQLPEGLENKYAYYDYAGYPEYRLDGQTLKFTHYLDKDTYYDLQLNRIFTNRKQSVFPNDPNGWEEGDVIKDKLRAVDSLGNQIVGGYQNKIGLHSTGYYYRNEDKNTDFTFSGDIVSQLTKDWLVKGGFDFTYYMIDRLQEAKAYAVIEDNIYNPFEGNIYIQNKLEFTELIMNLGLRYDFYNPNDKVYLNPFDPLDSYYSQLEEREANPETKQTTLTGQLSPRVGISHPISEKTVLHFSYGHFFQRAGFGNYGEGTGGSDEGQAVTGILNTYLADNIVWNLGNRNLKPRKTVAYEVGIEHNIGGIVTDITAFYKDITNTIRTVKVFMPSGDFYLTTGNSDYADSKGIEISIRKPFSGLWGGYLNYSWSTGIGGRSGDPDIIAHPESGVQTRLVNEIGDVIFYDPSRMKFGITFATPTDLTLFYGIFSNVQLSMDYQIYYPHIQIPSHNFSLAGKTFTREADKNADVRVRKEINLWGVKTAAFIEIHNAFNDKWVNVQSVVGTSNKDKIRFVNSRFSNFPQKMPNGASFPDVIQYRNLPRTIIFGFSVGF